MVIDDDFEYPLTCFLNVLNTIFVFVIIGFITTFYIKNESF